MHRRRAFTLIEMLVVIAVIAIIAGIVIGVLPAARNKAIRAGVKTDMNAIETAINSYKAKYNFYPPDNPQQNGHERPPLYYELTGTTNNNVNGVQYHSLVSNDILAQNQLQNLFGIAGFVNTGVAGDEQTADNFFKGKTPRVRDIPAAGGLPAHKVLVTSRYGPDKQPAIWHYKKTNATNNVGEYDLWVEIDMGGDRVVINNWEN